MVQERKILVMALLEIKKAGAPVLKEKCRTISRVDAKLRKLLDDMLETMYKANGIGLAAPQVGDPIRMVVIDIGEGPLELINPVITARFGSEVDSEGCLSVPDIFGEVERAAKITVEYTNRFNKKRKLHAEKLLARCIQHEIDHLDGILFIDIAQSLRQEKSA